MIPHSASTSVGRVGKPPILLLLEAFRLPPPPKKLDSESVGIVKDGRDEEISNLRLRLRQTKTPHLRASSYLAKTL